MQCKVKKVWYRRCISIDTLPIQIHCSQIQRKDTKNVSRYVSGRYSLRYSHTLGRAMQFPTEFSSNLFIPLLCAITCFSSYEVLYKLFGGQLLKLSSLSTVRKLYLTGIKIGIGIGINSHQDFGIRIGIKSKKCCRNWN